MSGLLFLSISLIAFVGALCIFIYREQVCASRAAKRRQEILNRMELRFHEMNEVQNNIQKRIDQLSTDVLQREIYQNASDRHQLAIKDAKAGRSLNELVIRHGLSSDEAALIVALHAGESTSAQQSIANANLAIPVSADMS